GIGQENRRVVAGERRRWQRDDLVDAGHERKQRGDPGGRGHREQDIAPRVSHICNRRQRHHGITQPVRRDDHEAFHDGLIVSMKIALLQINPTVGDLTGNADLIADAAAAAQRAGADLAVTPELALAGYLPRDLLLSEGFVARCWEVVAALAKTLAEGPAVLIGLPEPNPSDEGRPLF